MAKQMRKTRTGVVVRTPMEQTAVVEMVWKQRHRLYQKQVRRVTRFHVHDPKGECQAGDTVRIEETRPISKTKHWRLMEILQHRRVADALPVEMESDIVAEIAGQDDSEEEDFSIINPVAEEVEVDNAMIDTSATNDEDTEE
jgi:small subunit ribosomal protein S17